MRGACAALRLRHLPPKARRRSARDARLLRLDLKERPDHLFVLFNSVLFNMGMTVHYGDEYAAVKWLRKCLKASQPHASHVRKAYALLTAALRELGQTQECRNPLDAGLAVTPN